MKKSKIYGYIRVSSKDQNEARQMLALRQAGVPADQHGGQLTQIHCRSDRSRKQKSHPMSVNETLRKLS